MFNLLWDLHQQSRISQLEEKVSRVQPQTDRASNDFIALEERLDKPTLINMAVWSLLMEHTPLTEEDLLQRVHDIDMTDGKLDGKVRQQVQECPQCHRILSQKHRKCLYCGYKAKSSGVFDGVTG